MNGSRVLVIEEDIPFHNELPLSEGCGTGLTGITSTLKLRDQKSLIGTKNHWNTGFGTTILNSRYAPLGRHLETVFGDAITMSFSEIEEVLGFPLPPSARKHGPWWSNGASNAVWVAAGWKSEGRDMGAQSITFRRVLSGDEAKSTRAAPAFDGSSLLASDFSPDVDITIRFRWMRLGAVTITEAGDLQFPTAPNAPGLYRMLVCRGNRLEVYVGEAVKLRRRFGNYRKPGPTQTTSIRINELLREALASGASVSVDIAYEDVVLLVGGSKAPVDLGNKAARRLAEQAAIVAHGGIDVDMLNL